MAEQIRLTDGSAVELDREHWTGLASQECDSPSATGRSVTPRLAAMKHKDGRVIVFATVKDGLQTTSAGGELLATLDPTAVAGALGRLSSQFARGPFLLKHCLSQIDSKSVA